MHKLINLLFSYKKVLKRLIPIQLLRLVKNKIVHAEIAKYKGNIIDRQAFNEMLLGINLIGDIKAQIGLGQSMRLLANQLFLSKYDFKVFDFQLADNVPRNDVSWDHKISHTMDYNINLFHINPQELGIAYVKLDKNLWKNRYNIAFWLWELEEFPKEHIESIKFVDEIWTPSEFTSNSIRKVTNKPVHTIPYYVTAQADPDCGRSYFNLPEDKFLYLIMFDSNSTMLRKNPMAAVNAYKRAFDKNNQDVGLVIKVNNANKENLAVIQNALEGYQNIFYITETLEKSKVNSLIQAVDVFVSLHRAEGFGLVMAEAMLLKTACIATNWSSNTEFMDSGTACMVPYSKIQINESEGCYPKGSIWADPDVEATANYMKWLKENPNEYRTMVDKAYKHVSEILGKEHVVPMMEERISQIYQLVSKCENN